LRIGRLIVGVVRAAALTACLAAPLTGNNGRAQARHARGRMQVRVESGMLAERVLWQLPDSTRAEIRSISSGAYIAGWFHGPGNYRIGYSGADPGDSWSRRVRLRGREVEGRVRVSASGYLDMTLVSAAPPGVTLVAAQDAYLLRNDSGAAVTVTAAQDGAWAAGQLELRVGGAWRSTPDCTSDPRVARDWQLGVGQSVAIGPPELIEAIEAARARGIRARLVVVANEELSSSRDHTELRRDVLSLELARASAD
jgi:hypothetical protein